MLPSGRREWLHRIWVGGNSDARQDEAEYGEFMSVTEVTRTRTRAWSVGGRWSRLSFFALFATLTVGIAYVMYFDWRAVTFPYPLDYGEGPLLEQAVRLGQGLPIYRLPGPEPPWTVSNYPPLYPLLNGGLSLVFGPAYWYGRALSVLSTAGAGLFAGLIVGSISRDRLSAWVTGLLLPSIPYVGFWSGLARIDSLALMLSLAGLWCVVRWPRHTGALVAAVVLLAAAVYTRQTYLLAAPLTAFVWLLGVNRRRAALFASSLAALVLVIGFLVNRFTGGLFFFNVVTANVNEFDWSLLAFYGEGLLTDLPVLLAIIVAYLVVAVRARPGTARVIVPYLLAATIVGLTAAKIGSAPNYLLEFSVAGSLATGALLAWLRLRPRWHLLVTATLTAQLLGLLLFPYLLYQLEFERMDDAAESQLYEVVAHAEGSVLADEEMGMLPLVGQPIQLQPFELAQLAQAGRWNQEPLLANIIDRQYAVILIWIIPSFPLEQQRWTDEMLTTIEQAYVIDQRITRSNGETLVYRPRP